jgi:hypothetical protein
VITGARISEPNGAGRGSGSRYSRSTSGLSSPSTDPRPGTEKGISSSARTKVGDRRPGRRQTRMVRLLHLSQRDGDTLHDALKARMAGLPAALLRSITWDQGTEMARHLTITRSLGVPVYFCDSHWPWLRGSNRRLALGRYAPRSALGRLRRVPARRQAARPRHRYPARGAQSVGMEVSPMGSDEREDHPTGSFFAQKATLPRRPRLVSGARDRAPVPQLSAQRSPWPPQTQLKPARIRLHTALLVFCTSS